MKISRDRLTRIVSEEYARIVIREGLTENFGSLFGLGKKQAPEKSTGSTPPAAKQIGRMLDNWEEMTWGGERDAQNQLTNLFSQLPPGEHRQRLVAKARKLTGRTDLTEKAHRALRKAIHDTDQNE